MLTDEERFLFGEGTYFRSYEKFGAHRASVSGKKGYFFNIWVPKAQAVYVTGSFNDWSPDEFKMQRSVSDDIWSLFIPGVKAGDLYKYVIKTEFGDIRYKADPFAFEAQCPPETASRVTDLSGYSWKDRAWLTKRRNKSVFQRPLNIYEVHLGSWKRNSDGTYMTYRQLATELVEYTVNMGYTHIELLPIMEHPFDGSWGYQITGYYAPTSRYGTPEDFMFFIDSCHKAGLGVILDWVPGHFCRDDHGLGRFANEKVYEKDDHAQWGTYKFDLGKGEVRSFLISNALFWLGKYHVDGIRVDGVTSMLYLNFGIDDPRLKKYNEKGTEEDFVSIDFVRKTNQAISKYYPDVMLIAEESTAWPLVTYPPDDGGLGFHFKWDMGWMNDTLHYMQTDFPYRPSNHKLLSFSMMYAFNENFILPLSHDEVVHGKCSLIGRMPGDYWRQFAGMRVLRMYQMTHPGAKLSFMGNEIAEFIEWRYYESLEWFLTKYEKHKDYQMFVRELNMLFQNEKALWQNNYSWDGFEWLDANDADQSILTFIRHGAKPADDLVVVLNFVPNVYGDYRIGVPAKGRYKEIFNSDMTVFGGSGKINRDIIPSEPIPWHGKENSVSVKIPPVGGLILKRAENKRSRKETK